MLWNHLPSVRYSRQAYSNSGAVNEIPVVPYFVELFSLMDVTSSGIKHQLFYRTNTQVRIIELFPERIGPTFSL